MATIPNLTDTTAWPDADLERLLAAAKVETDRRYTIAAAQQTIKDAANAHADAVKNAPATPWVAGMSVGPGGKVTEGGVEYVNVTLAWLPAPPSQYPLGWRRTTPPATAAEWKVGETVKAGDLRQRAGKVYKCIQGHVTAAHYAPDLPGMTALWALA